MWLVTQIFCTTIFFCIHLFMNNKEKSLREKRVQFLWFCSSWKWIFLTIFFTRNWMAQIFLWVGSLNCYQRYFTLYIRVLLVLPRQLSITLCMLSIKKLTLNEYIRKWDYIWYFWFRLLCKGAQGPNPATEMQIFPLIKKSLVWSETKEYA